MKQAEKNLLKRLKLLTDMVWSVMSPMAQKDIQKERRNPVNQPQSGAKPLE